MNLKTMEELMPFEVAMHTLIEHQDEIAKMCGSLLPLAIVTTRAEISSKYDYYLAQKKMIRRARIKRWLKN